MSVLGTLAKRLQTDIADTARAAVDPVFSRQLTQANFQKDRDDRQRRQALEDQAQALAAKEREDTFNIQKTILMKAHDMAINDPTGDIVSPGWINFMKTATNQNMLPQIQEAGSILMEGVGQRSADANKQIFEQVLELDKAMREKTEHEFSPEKRAQNELIDKKWKKDYSSAQDIAGAQNFNRQSAIDSIRNTYGVIREDEKDGLISEIAAAGNDQEAKEIYINSLGVANDRYQSKRGVLAFPERFTDPVPWTTPDGKRIGIKQRGPDGKFVYTRDQQSPLVSMNSGKQADMVLSDFKEIRDKARFAEKTINNLDFIEAAIGDIETGSMTDFKVGISQLAASLNLPYSKEVSSLEGARTAAGELVMAGLNNFPGQISNSERDFLVERMPGLTQTKEGRKLIVNLLRRAAEETIINRRMMEKYVNRPEPTYFPEGEKSYFQEWDEYRAENPLWQDIPVPKGMEENYGVPRVIVNPQNQTLYYLSLDGNYRDKDRNLWESTGDQ